MSAWEAPCLSDLTWMNVGDVYIGYQENFFTERIIQYWNRLPRGVVDSPSLELLKKCVIVALGDNV